MTTQASTQELTTTTSLHQPSASASTQVVKDIGNLLATSNIDIDANQSVSPNPSLMSNGLRNGINLPTQHGQKIDRNGKMLSISESTDPTSPTNLGMNLNMMTGGGFQGILEFAMAQAEKNKNNPDYFNITPEKVALLLETVAQNTSNLTRSASLTQEVPCEELDLCRRAKKFANDKYKDRLAKKLSSGSTENVFTVIGSAISNSFSSSPEPVAQSIDMIAELKAGPSPSSSNNSTIEAKVTDYDFTSELNASKASNSTPSSVIELINSADMSLDDLKQNNLQVDIPASLNKKPYGVKTEFMQETVNLENPEEQPTQRRRNTLG